jgi:uncharacterized protein YdeI (YjbR/CyaY-like superfamily)
MTPSGLAKVEEAKRDGSWNVLDRIDELWVPEELRAALDADRQAREGFDLFTPSQQKLFLWWLHSAKRAGTKASRIEEIIRLSAEKKDLSERTYRQGDRKTKH